ncbi:MAG: sodium:calcium antiporter [Planctomycetota bacterium]|nr:sodium:calcium antiporter [Planctomycetota bacterium]
MLPDLINSIEKSPNGILLCGLLLLAGVFLLVIGGEGLVRGAIGIAKKFGIGSIIVGLTIVAFGTSAPELAFNVFAAANGHGEISIGNIFGSNIANLALVLGLAAVVDNHMRRKRNQIEPRKKIYDENFVKREGRWLVSTTVGIVVLTWVASQLQEDWSVLGFSWPCGVLLLITFILFFQHVILKSAKSEQSLHNGQRVSLPKCIGLLILGILFLGIGGKAAEIGAVTAAKIVGISDIYVGVTIVALATSLPEVVTSIIAVRKDEGGMAVGNIVGSNLFNVLLVLPVTMSVPLLMGNPAGNIIIPEGQEIWIYAFSMLVITIVAYHHLDTKKDISDEEGYSLLALYVIFIVVATAWQA